MDVNEKYLEVIGTETEHYTIDRLLRVDNTTRKTSNTTVRMPVYECTCKHDPTHPHFERTWYHINYRKEYTGCPICAKRIRNERVEASAINDATGTEIGGCTCLGPTDPPRNEKGKIMYRWRCSVCGKVFIRTLAEMTAAEKRSNPNVERPTLCDCYQDEYERQCHALKKSNVGGITRASDRWMHSAYNVVAGIISRTTDPRHVAWPSYGGRTDGRPISIRAPWYTGDDIECRRHDLNTMIQWLSDNGWDPFSNLSVDRINTNDDYCPENCRVATAAEQTDNRINTVCLQYGKDVYVGSAASRLIGRSPSSINSREFGKTIMHRLNPELVIKRDKYGNYRDTNGFMRMIPFTRAFPLYPDNWNDKVHNWAEYIERLTTNIRNGIPTRVYFPMLLDDELQDLGIDPFSENIIWLNRSQEEIERRMHHER